MRRYIITCEISRAKRSSAIADCIRKLASEWHHPLGGVWLVSTALNASDIREALLSELDFQDRVYICEAGVDSSQFNAIGASGGKITQIGEVRAKNRMLASIFSRDGKSSRHLKPAASTGFKAPSLRSWRSA